MPGNVRLLCFVINAGSGRHDAEQVTRRIASVMAEADEPHRIFHVEDSDNIGQVARLAVAEAEANEGAVVAVGGDGTLGAVAQAVLGTRCVFGAIPQGTFNYFGRSHGLPEDLDEALRALLTARIEPVPVGLANGRVFLVNASLGLYPVALEIREEQKQRHGRRRIVAFWAALLAILRRPRPMRVQLEVDGVSRVLQTLTVFVGINPLQLEQIGVEETVRRRQLVVVVLRPAPAWRLAWLVVRGTLGHLVDASGVEHVVSTVLTVAPVSPHLRQLKIAADGETAWTRVPVEFRIADEPLRVLLPRKRDGETRSP